MSQNNTTSAFPAKGNPYEVLSLPNFSTAAEIKKKFRKLSLKFHPDKRSPNLTQSENDELNKQFIAVREARDFLLNDDHKIEKDRYDAKLKSESVRKEDEKRREAAMSSRRKRMRDDLESKISTLRKTDDFGKSKKSDFEDLKQDGIRMREEYAVSRKTAEEKFAARERKKRKEQLGNRQVRVKWSRKKVGGQSDDMIAKTFLRFGTVEFVELIGNKGNAALVTFQNASSCKPCVEFYLNSLEMRASYVGKRKDEEDAANGNPVQNMLHQDRDREGVEERKLRQAAEREILLRKLEMGDDFDAGHVNQTDLETDSNADTKNGKSSKVFAFPPFFPANRDNVKESIPRASCLERLQGLEKELLKGLLSPQEMIDMQVKTS